MANDPTLANESLVALLRARPLGGPALEVAHALSRSNNVRERILARRALCAQGALGSDGWRDALDDPSPEARRDAVEWAAREGFPVELLPALRERLEDTDALVSEAACFALGEHGDHDAVDAMCRIASDHEDPRCREAALGALGAIGDERAKPTVLGALNDRASVRRRAVVALAAFEGDDVDAALEVAREDRDWQVRAAVDQLDPHGVEELD